MSWSKETMEALHEWLCTDTCFRWQEHDTDRFYLFIGHVWRDCNGKWAEDIAREKIKHKVKEHYPEIDDNFLDEFVENIGSKGTDLLSFLTALKGKGILNELIQV